MRIGRRALAIGAIAVGTAGLLLGSGAASGTVGLGPWRMMSHILGSGQTGTASQGAWGMMGYLGRASASDGTYPSYSMMGGYPGNGPEPATGAVSQSAGARAAAGIPAGATVSRAAKIITFNGSKVRFTAVAGPAGGPELSFEIARMTNPTIVVSRGAEVTVQVINEDTVAPHDFAVSSTVGGTPAFEGAKSAMLSTASGSRMPSSTFTFTAAAAGSYVYWCTVPGHAQGGMQGTFIVTP